MVVAADVAVGRTLYVGPRAQVTTTRAVFGPHDYALADVRAVQLAKKPGPQLTAIFFGVVGVAIGVILVPWLGGAITLAAAIGHRFSRNTYAVRLSVGERQIDVLTSTDKVEVAGIVDAINVALSDRG